jgi:ribonuclease Z
MLEIYPEIIKIEKFGLTIKGWSRGSQNTGFMIPELRTLFDTQSRSQFDPEFIFITHSHTDHCFSLPMRVLNISTHPKVYVPTEAKQFISDFIDATFRMGYCDASYKHNYNIIGVHPDEIISLKNNFSVKVYDLCHNIPCRGYGLQHIRTKLKPEYIDTPKNEIISLRKNKVQITMDVKENVFAYLTDTTPDVFARYPELLTYNYVMTECTFLPCDSEKTDIEIQLAEKAQHTHWSKIYPIIKDHPEIMFILIHFSHRYTDEDLLRFKETVPEKNVLFAI